jgi:hypothetical protein
MRRRTFDVLAGAIVAFAAAAVMLIMSVFGVMHLRRAASESEVLPKLATRAEVNAA